MVETEKIFLELQKIKQEIFRGKTGNPDIGEHRSNLRGAGFDIYDINKWRKGEPLDSIDWALTLPGWPKTILKIEKPETKKAPAVLVVDISPSIFVEVDQATNKFRLLLHLTGALGFAANYFHDPVGILCVSDSIEFYLPPKFGSGQIFYAIKLIIERAKEFEALKKKNKFVRKTSNLNASFEFLAARLRRQCSIVILSDFMDIINGESEINYQVLEFLSAKHNWNVIAIFLDDPNELGWRRSRGTVLVRNIETGVAQKVRADRATNIRRAFLEKTGKLRETFEKSGVDSTVLNFGDHFNDLAQFLSEKRAKHR